MGNGAGIHIVGAGPTGLAAAVELVRRGIRPRIIDHDAGPTPPGQSRALGILPATLRVLEASGLTERLLAEGERVDRFTIRLGAKTVATIRTDAARTPYPFILMLPQGRTERLMIDWLAERGLDVEWNTALDDLEEDASGVDLRLSTGEERRADVVLACDGARSRVRAALGIEWAGEDYEATFALADLRLSQPIDASEGQALLRRRGGATALLPLRPDLVRVVGFEVSTKAVIADFPNVAEIVWESDFSVSFRHAAKMTKGRVFLAGDAAHVHSPVGARGMNIGIHDAATFAYLLAEGRAGEYEAERLPVARRVTAQTRRMTDFILRRPALADAALERALPLAVRLPFARRRIAEGMLGLDLSPSWLR